MLKAHYILNQLPYKRLTSKSYGLIDLWYVRQIFQIYELCYDNNTNLD